VLGQTLDSVADIARINRLVRANSLDLLQADHTLSGIDIALWDLLGRRAGQPVYRLLGYDRAHPKIAYASQLFGADPAATYALAKKAAAAGFRAVKFGWGPFGLGSPAADEEQVRAARAGLGDDGELLVDAGTVWHDDVARAEQCLPVLEDCDVTWLEEPFVSGAFASYSRLAARADGVKMAGGEGCHDFHQARNMIDFAGIGFVQIDTGRIGGITTAKAVADHAAARQVRFVNHTFTTHLALSASLQPYAGLAQDDLCEYPFDPSPLGREFTRRRLEPDANGCITVPDAPGLGVEPDLKALQKYLQDVEIRIGGKVLFRSSALA
jgi:L-alanine-DL-glutamate epimerase-like enolase superfamily enzyme